VYFKGPRVDVGAWPVAVDRRLGGRLSPLPISPQGAGVGAGARKQATGVVGALLTGRRT